jgi:glycosyltransferase involved in cell wall biosynthesis
VETKPAGLGGSVMAAGAARLRIVLVMPALDEEEALPLVFQDLAPYRRAPASGGEVPAGPLIDEVVVVDNGSRDRTSEIARAAGATVLCEPERGYGAACLCALQHLREDPPDVVLFMDADRSDDVSDLQAVLRPILEGSYDMVVGSRTLGASERGAVTPQQRFGNWIATGWIRSKYGFQYTDLGPFRALRYDALERLGLADRDFGWNVEMQVRALQAGLRVTEVPVRYRRRVGQSKISGTIVGSVRAGAKILQMLWKLRAPVPTGERAPTGRNR